MQFLFRLKSSSFQESWLDPPFLLDIYAVVGPEYFFFYLVCTNTCVLMLYTLLKCNYPSTNRICWPQGTLFNSWARQSSSHFWNRCPIRHQIVVKNTKKKADSLSVSNWKREVCKFWFLDCQKDKTKFTFEKSPVLSRWYEVHATYNSIYNQQLS